MSPTTVYIELPRTPIYRRIATALGTALAQRGLQVMAVKPEGFSADSFLSFLRQHGRAGAAYLSTASGNIVQSLQPGTTSCFFESFDGPLVFLHQDTLLGGMDLLDCIARLQAWQRVGERSSHLCIEAGNLGQLASVGISRSALVPHASEFTPMEPRTEGFTHEVAFVGHAVPEMFYGGPPGSARLLQFIQDAVRLRRTDFSQPLAPHVARYVDQAIEGLGSPVDQAVLRVAHTEWLRNAITGQSLPLRGWVFEHSGIPSLDIFGGDPAYLHQVDRRLVVERPGVRTHAAVYEPAELQQLFRGSRVHLNISSLQFDHAVVNRFHDVILSGGLCLTDARDGLAALTPAHADELSFRTLDELRERAAWFTNPANARQRALLIQAVQQDVLRNSGYGLLAEAILQALRQA